MKVPFAPFHKDLCDLLQANETADDLTNIIIGFRGSAKSSIVNMAFPIWRIVTGRSHFVVILADTLPQTKMHIANLRDELETNKLLRGDWGPFDPRVKVYEDDEVATWTKTDMVIRRYKAMIIARSKGQKVRGSLFKQWRPDTIIGDDLEDLKSVRTKEERDLRYKWITGEAFESGESGATKRVVVGNLLHSRSLMSRLREDIEQGRRTGRALTIPLLRDDGTCTWLGKYPTKAAIEAKKKEVGDLITWMREYLLKIVPDEGQPVLEDWIVYYDELPGTVAAKAIGVDLAISKKETADYTAFVPAYLDYELDGEDERPVIYVRPTVQARLTFRETIDQARALILTHGQDAMLFVENVAYQQAAIEEMQREALPVTEVRPGSDKMARLRAVATHLQSGRIRFPRHGCEDLLIELLHFGTEAHDDLVDAFVYAVLGLLQGHANRPFIFHA